MKYPKDFVEAVEAEFPGRKFKSSLHKALDNGWPIAYRYLMELLQGERRELNETLVIELFAKGQEKKILKRAERIKRILGLVKRCEKIIKKEEK
jgi:hypothetical protein